MNSRTTRWAFMLIIAVVGLAVYSNTFNVPFQWDGDSHIKENQIIRNLDNFTSPTEASGHTYYDHMLRRYVTYLTFAINYRIHGFDYPGYHVVNTSVHIINALLLFALVLSLFRTPMLKDSTLAHSSHVIAFMCGLFFVAHPMQTMGVTYIYQRLTSLVALFYLASTLAYLHFRLADKTTKRYVFYVASLICALIAMKTKENAITLPVIIVLMEFVFFSGPVLKRSIPIIPMFLIAAIIPATMLALSEETGGLASRLDDASKIAYTGTRQEYLFTQFRVLVKYLGLYALPMGQTLIHHMPPSKTFFEFSVIMSFAFLCFLVGLAVWLLARSRSHRPEFAIISFGIIWFFVTHSIESSIIPLNLKVQEHRNYLPSVGIFLSAVTGGMVFINGISKQIVRKAAVWGMAFLAILYAFAAHERNMVWATPLILWQDVVDTSPQNPKGYNNLALEFERLGDIEKAEALYLKALDIFPNFAQPNNNLGKIYQSRGETDKAIEHFEAAIRIDPKLNEAHNNLGAIYGARGKKELAMEHFNKALELDPDFAVTYYNMGNYYYRLNDYEKAIRNYNQALVLDPNFVQAYTNIGATLVKAGNYEEAAKYFVVAVRMSPKTPKSHYNLGYALFKLKRYDLARQSFIKTLSLDPSHERANEKLKETEAILRTQQGQ